MQTAFFYYLTLTGERFSNLENKSVENTPGWSTKRKQDEKYGEKKRQLEQREKL